MTNQPRSPKLTYHKLITVMSMSRTAISNLNPWSPFHEATPSAMKKWSDKKGGLS